MFREETTDEILEKYVDVSFRACRAMDSQFSRLLHLIQTESEETKICKDTFSLCIFSGERFMCKYILERHGFQNYILFFSL